MKHETASSDDVSVPLASPENPVNPERETVEGLDAASPGSADSADDAEGTGHVGGFESPAPVATGQNNGGAPTHTVDGDQEAPEGRDEVSVPRQQPHRLVSAGWTGFILPTVCLVLAIASMFYVFTDWFPYAREDLVGPLPLEQVILMVGIGGFVLSGVTLLLAIVPDPGPVVEAIEFTREVEQAFPNDTTPTEISQVLRGGETIPTTEVLDALAECVTRVNRDLEVATARTLHERNRAQIAHQRAEEAEARVQGLLDGTSDEGILLYRDVTEAVSRSFIAERAEHEASTQRLVDSLKAAKSRAAQEAEDSRKRLAEVEAAAKDRESRILIEEYRKIHVALNAVSAAVADDFPNDAAVIQAHLERLRATLQRLAPADPATPVDPDSATPQMPHTLPGTAATATWTPGPPIVTGESAKPSKPSKKRKRGLKRNGGHAPNAADTTAENDHTPT